MPLWSCLRAVDLADEVNYVFLHDGLYCPSIVTRASVQFGLNVGRDIRTKLKVVYPEDKG